MVAANHLREKMIMVLKIMQSFPPYTVFELTNKGLLSYTIDDESRSPSQWHDVHNFSDDGCGCTEVQTDIKAGIIFGNDTECCLLPIDFSRTSDLVIKQMLPELISKYDIRYLLCRRDLIPDNLSSNIYVHGHVSVPPRTSALLTHDYQYGQLHCNMLVVLEPRPQISPSRTLS